LEGKSPIWRKELLRGKGVDRDERIILREFDIGNRGRCMRRKAGAARKNFI